jgi:hypothetical protein
MPRRRLLATALGVVAVTAALAGCGGSDAPDTEQDRAEITRMLKTGLGTNDAAVMCTKTLSAGLAARVFGTASQCVAVQGRAAAGRTPPTGIEVTGVRVDGDRGTATVRLRGGDEDGTAGPVSVTREPGGWRLSDLSTAFLRSELTSAFGGGSSLDRKLRECMISAITALDDRSLRQLAFGGMSGQPQAQKQISALVSGCAKAAADPAGGETI